MTTPDNSAAEFTAAQKLERAISEAVAEAMSSGVTWAYVSVTLHFGRNREHAFQITRKVSP